MQSVAMKTDRVKPQVTKKIALAEGRSDWLDRVAAEADGIQHGEVHIHFVDGRAKRIVRTESTMLS